MFYAHSRQLTTVIHVEYACILKHSAAKLPQDFISHTTEALKWILGSFNLESVGKSDEVQLKCRMEDSWREHRVVRPHQLTTSNFSWDSRRFLWNWRADDAGASHRYRINAKLVFPMKVDWRWEDISFSRRAVPPCCLLRSVLSQRSQSTDRWWWQPAGFRCRSQWLRGNQPLLINHRYTVHQRQQQ